jgi:hypothetical protein
MDTDALAARAGELAAHIESEDSQMHDSYQKWYCELLVNCSQRLRDASASLTAAHSARQDGIGGYDALTALAMGEQSTPYLVAALQTHLGYLRTWNNEGWCPWTPALWMRMLWLGRDMLGSAGDLTKQLEYIDANLSPEGAFQFREPYCLIYSIVLMDHPVGNRMADRFSARIAADQHGDGGWGEFSYIAFMVLRKWGLLDKLLAG